MPTPSSSDLRIYFPSKYLTADDDGLPIFIADAGATRKTIINAIHTQADDF